ncbi:unnamed protein product, partial [Didymodactylos carnosus]
KKQLVENKKQIKNIESKMTTINQDIQKQEHVKSGAEQKLLQSENEIRDKQTEIDRYRKNVDDHKQTYDGIKRKHDQQAQNIQRQIDLKASTGQQITSA